MQYKVVDLNYNSCPMLIINYAQSKNTMLEKNCRAIINSA